MNNHQGEATVVLDDGQTVPVYAHLTARVTGGRDEWSGTLVVRGQENRTRLQNLDQAEIRVGDQVRTILIIDRTRIHQPGTDVGQLGILGNDERPF